MLHVHVLLFSSLSRRLTEILIKLGAAVITLPPPHCAVCSPITAICSLLNSRGLEQLGCELEVVALVCACVCRRRRRTSGGGDTKHCLIFDKHWGLLCAAAVWHVFPRPCRAVPCRAVPCCASSLLQLLPWLSDLDRSQVRHGSLPRYRLAISATWANRERRPRLIGTWTLCRLYRFKSGCYRWIRVIGRDATGRLMNGHATSW